MAGRAALVAMLSTVAAALTAGCGGGDGGRATTDPSVAQVPAVTLSVQEPDGDTVPARVVDGAWVADVRVAGQSQPGSLVRVTTGCRQPACERSAQTDGAGRWWVRLRAQAPPARPYARIVAELAGQSALTLVKLRPPAAERERASADDQRRAGARPQRRRHRAGAASGVRAGTEGVPEPPPPATLPEAAPAAPPEPASSAAATGLLMVGDSLAVGTQSLLPAQLPGWSIATDARNNRTLAEGMARWRLEKGNALVNAFSLFTNDNPGNIAALEAAVRETAAAGCAVWATISRPPQGGVSYARANATLERLAAQLPGRVVVVPWASAAADHPEWLISDQVHATAAGYRARAELYAQAAQSCL
ncbi:MAG: hypothetical protein R2736_11755 [Solirubrobacterales bacterium]